jgi:hypothetical protein
MHRALLLLLCFLFVATRIAPAQNATTFSTTQTSTSSALPLPIERDAQAMTLASRTLQAIAGISPVQDITLQTTAAWVAGSDEETGSATLEAKSDQESRVVLNLSSGQHQEVRDFSLTSATTSPPGAWAGVDGTWHAEATHNCWTSADWFFPAFSLQDALNDPTISLLYAGPNTFEGVPAVQVKVIRNVQSPAAGATSLIQRLSTVNFYLDPTSGLPLGMAFNVHPDNDAGLDIPVEIHFSDYQNFNGVQVPTHIQKLLQGSLLLDLKVNSAQINSGLTDSDFAIPATVAAATGGAQ